MAEIKIVCTDLDGTLAQYDRGEFHSSWDALAWVLPDDRRKEWDENLKKYYPRPDLYEEWNRKDAQLLKGIPIKDAEKVLFPIPYSPGAREFFIEKSGRYITGILSSGIDIVARRACQELGMNFWRANVFGVRNGRFDGSVEQIDMWRKHEVLLEILAEEFPGIKPENVCYVGDHEIDIAVFKVVGLPIAMNPKNNDVVEAAEGRVITDFRELEEYLT
ncbi:hypothetical protein D6745_03995 [Candidatus Woesearchaeota archaeon]|nr:MAG: hypothetical protein D6745_03995 [Candidatus Woesearchaeota archaeon]